jgi:hypothetical protein
MSVLTANKSDLSDLSIEEKKTVRPYYYDDISAPLALFHKLHSKGTNPNNTIKPPDKPEPPLPEREPTFSEAEERLLCDFYCSRPRSERLTMHRRTVYLRADQGWPWKVCELQADHEGWIAAGSPPGPFTMASDEFNERTRAP